jgi:hypothetical protein
MRRIKLVLVAPTTLAHPETADFEKARRARAREARARQVSLGFLLPAHQPPGAVGPSVRTFRHPEPTPCFRAALPLAPPFVTGCASRSPSALPLHASTPSRKPRLGTDAAGAAGPAPPQGRGSKQGPASLHRRRQNCYCSASRVCCHQPIERAGGPDIHGVYAISSEVP